MRTVHTDWSKATTNVHEAIASLLSCIESGRKAWIEVRKNGDQEYPVERKNPLLDNPFNWTYSCSVVKNQLEHHDFFNETERDMSYNWTAFYGTEEAIKKYQEENIVTEDLFDKGDIIHPIRIKDVNENIKMFRNDDYEYGHFWATIWKPKVGIPYYATDESIDKVFTICYTTETPDKSELIKKAGKFLSDYADLLEDEKTAKEHLDTKNMPSAKKDGSGFLAKIRNQQEKILNELCEELKFFDVRGLLQSVKETELAMEKVKNELEILSIIEEEGEGNILFFVTDKRFKLWTIRIVDGKEIIEHYDTEMTAENYDEYIETAKCLCDDSSSIPDYFPEKDVLTQLHITEELNETLENSFYLVTNDALQDYVIMNG